MLGYFIQGLLLGFPTAAQPGPFQAFLLGESFTHGWRKTLPASLAPLLSDGPIIVLTLAILSTLPPFFLFILRIFGAAYLIYLAVKMFKSSNTPPINESAMSKGEGLRKAILVNMLGPGPWIFWSSIGGPLLIESARSSLWYPIAFLIGFYASMVGTFILYIRLFGLIDHSDIVAARRIKNASGLLLVLFATILLYQTILLILQ